MMPDANRHLKRCAFLCWSQMVESRLVESQSSVRRHVANSANLFAILEEFVIRENGRQKDSERHCLRGRLYGESVPREAIQVGIPLLRPGFVGMEQRPRGVVEVRGSPARIVTGMETPEPIQRNHGLAIRNERESCGMRRGCTGSRIGACCLGEGGTAH